MLVRLFSFLCCPHIKIKIKTIISNCSMCGGFERVCLKKMTFCVWFSLFLSPIAFRDRPPVFARQTSDKPVTKTRNRTSPYIFKSPVGTPLMYPHLSGKDTLNKDLIQILPYNVFLGVFNLFDELKRFLSGTLDRDVVGGDLFLLSVFVVVVLQIPLCFVSLPSPPFFFLETSHCFSFYLPHVGVLRVTMGLHW